MVAPVAAACCAVVVVVVVFFFFPPSSRKRKDVVHFRLPPVIGTFGETFAKVGTPETPWLVLELKRLCGLGVFRLALPGYVVAVTDAEAARFVLTSRAVDKRHGGGLAKDIPTVFTRRTFDPRQAPKRKLAAPAFSAKRVEATVRSPAFRRVVDDDLCAILDRGTPFDPSLLMTAAVLDVLGKVSLGGIDFRTLESYDDDEGGEKRQSKSESSSSSSSLGQTFLKELPICLREYSSRRMFNPYRKYYYRLTPSGRRAFVARERLWEVSAAVLRHRALLKNDDDVCAILDHIVAAKGPYATDDERVVEVLTYLIAGHDTTGFSLAFALYEVAKRGPTFTAQLRREVKEDTFLRQDSLFDRTCKETLRLWPVAAMGSFRRVTDPDGLHLKTQNIDYHLPKNTTCMMPFLTIMRTAEGLKHPDTFDPDRWLDPDQAAALHTSFFPFSVGLRNCLGMSLAQAELKHILAALVARYDFALVADFKPDFFLTMKPLGGLLKATKVVPP